MPEIPLKKNGCRLLLVVLATSGLVVGSSGCALMRRKGPSPEYLEQAKQLWHRGVNALELGQVNEAEKLLRKAAEATPDDPDARGHLADALWQSGARDEAIAHAEAACQCEPCDCRSVIRAGQMRLAEGNAGHAADWANRAIGLDAQSAEAWALRGRAQQRLGKTDQALADLQQALRFAPNDTELLTDLALLHRARGEHRRCLATVHHLLDCHAPGNEPPEALTLAGEAYLALNRPEEASERLRLAESRGGGDASLFYRLAEAEAACGQRDQAIASAERALQVDANHSPSRQLLAQLARQGESTLR